MKPYLINSDVFFVQRQQWLQHLQDRHRMRPVDYPLLAGVVLLGVLCTFILLAW